MQSLRLKPLGYEQLLSGVSGITEAQARIARILNSPNRLGIAHPITATYALDLVIEHMEQLAKECSYIEFPFMRGFNLGGGFRLQELERTAFIIYGRFLDLELFRIRWSTPMNYKISQLYPEIAGMDETKRAIATVWASLHAARVLTLVIRKMP